jgi:hypothetical protein
MHIRHTIAYLVGGLEALLLARLLLRLLAARPDNPVIGALFGATGPLTAPLAALDAGQPRFGATLEFSTLALILLLPVIGVLAYNLAARLAGRGERE